MKIFITWNISCQDFPGTRHACFTCACLMSCAVVEQRSLSSSKLHLDSLLTSDDMVQNLSMLFIFFFSLTLILLPIFTQSGQKNIFFIYILASRVTLLGPRAGGSTREHFAQRSEYMLTLCPKCFFQPSLKNEYSVMCFLRSWTDLCLWKCAYL